MLKMKIKSQKLLSQVASGQKVIIADFLDDLETKSTLMGMGILPGDHIEVITRSPFGSPIFFRHDKNNFFALRKNQANFITVE